MAFNDESLVREIAKSKIPTITGIGHKPDITLADYASDSNQETPTAAAIKAVPDSLTLKQDLVNIDDLLVRAIKNVFNFYENKFKNMNIIIKSKSPLDMITSLRTSFSQNQFSLNKLAPCGCRHPPLLTPTDTAVDGCRYPHQWHTRTRT